MPSKKKKKNKSIFTLLLEGFSAPKGNVAQAGTPELDIASLELGKKGEEELRKRKGQSIAQQINFGGKFGL